MVHSRRDRTLRLRERRITGRGDKYAKAPNVTDRDSRVRCHARVANAGD